MRRRYVTRAACAAALGLTLTGCDDAPRVENGRAGFKSNYLVARAALEGGQFDRAARSYKALLRDGGPLEPRLRLEYAHALLRVGQFGKAADEAQAVAAGLTGTGRSAALAVRGTALHEQARAEIRLGRRGQAQAEMLRAARAALQEMLAQDPDLDPTGGMQTRVTQIGQELQGLS